MFIVAVRFIDGVLCFFNGCFVFLSRLVGKPWKSLENPPPKNRPQPPRSSPSHVFLNVFDFFLFGCLVFSRAFITCDGRL